LPGCGYAEGTLEVGSITNRWSLRGLPTFQKIVALGRMEIVLETKKGKKREKKRRPLLDGSGAIFSWEGQARCRSLNITCIDYQLQNMTDEVRSAFFIVTDK
jgi:hypothetical protein